MNELLEEYGFVMSEHRPKVIAASNQKPVSKAVFVVLITIALCLFSVWVAKSALDRVNLCFLECGIPPEPPNPVDLPILEFLATGGCASECWQVLEPGKTTKAQVHQFFDTLPFGGLIEGSLWGYDWYVRGSSGRQDEYFAQASIKDGILAQIWLAGPFNVSLGDILDRFGEPSYVWIGLGSYGPTTTAEISFQLLYPEDGLVFESVYWDQHPEDGTVTFCPREDNVVYDVFMVRPGPAESIARDLFEPGGAGELAQTTIERIVADYMEWPGFRCIDVP